MGKTPEHIQEEAVAITTDKLTGYQLAEAAKASKWRMLLLLIQLFSTVPIAASVFVDDPVALYWLAAVSVFFLVLWWTLSGSYSQSRNASQAARRLNLLLNGLGATFSAADWHRVDSQFTVTEDAAESRINPSYYASTLPPSTERLAEILEESAFFTSSVQASSAKLMRFVLLALVALAIILGLCAIPTAEDASLVLGVRLLLACAVFLMSSDVLGTLRAHAGAAKAAEQIRISLGMTLESGSPKDGVFLAALEYVSVMTLAPEPLPLVFKSQRQRLDQRWSRYQADKV